MKYGSLLFAFMTVLSLVITINSNFDLIASSLVLSVIDNDKGDRSNSESDNSINNKLGFSIYSVELAYAQINDTSIPNTSINNSMHFYTNAADMPTARSEAAATNIGARIYVIGGAPGALDIVEIYDVATDTWISSKNDGPSSVAPLPVGVNHAAAASYDGKLYVIGGFLEGRVASGYLFIYDPIENAWSRGADMPTSRAALTANFINGTLYAVGGTNEDASALDIVEAYNPSNNTWTTNIDQMPTARQHLSSAVVDGKLYVIGGRISGPSTNLNSTERFDPKLGNWTILDDMPSKRSGLAAAAIGDNIYVFGGESSNHVFDNNEKYSTRTGNWTSQIPFPTPRHGLAAVVVDKDIYLIGGGLEPTRSSPAASIVEIYRTNGSAAITKGGSK